MAAVLILVSAICNRVLFTKACSDLLSVIFCYNNWWQIFNHTSYFENAGAPSPFTHCWSLAIEAQFYMLYPILLIFLSHSKNHKKKIALVTIALAFLSLGLMWILFDPAKDPSRVYYGTDTRVFSLLFGAFLALVTEYSRTKIKIPYIYMDMIGASALAVLLYMMIAIDGYSSFLYRGGQGIASLLTVLILFSFLNENSLLGKLLNVSFLKWIGERSYGIYLWHYPIILLISKGKKSSWWVILIEVSLTVLLSALSYHYIETPVRHGVIGNSINIIRSRPRTRRERRIQIRTLKKSIKAAAVTLAVGIAAVLCIAFVPREKTLNNIEDLEAQAKKASEITTQKVSDSNAKTTKKSAAKSTNVQSDQEILENLNLLLIGDSIALGATDEFYEVFPNSISDTAVSRYTTESFKIYESYVNEQNWNGDGVIFALGSNGLLYDSLPTLRGMIAPEKPMFILTSKTPYTTWEESNNAEVYQFAKTAENVYLIDWYKTSEGHSEYFIEDETHLTSEGAKAYIDDIKEAVLQVYRK